MPPRPSAALLALALAGPALAEEISLPPEMTAYCEAGAVLDPAAVSRVAIGADGLLMTVVSGAGLTCENETVPYLCGSGGCTTLFRVGDVTLTRQAESWEVIQLSGRPVLLIGLDGGWCGGAGAEGCYEALVWSEGRFLTIREE